MRNTIIGIVIGIVIGVVVGATVVAPRLKPVDGRIAAVPILSVEQPKIRPTVEIALAPIEKPDGKDDPTTKAAEKPGDTKPPETENAIPLPVKPEPVRPPVIPPHDHPAPPPPAEPNAVHWKMGSAYASTLPQLGSLAKRLERDIWRVSNGMLEIKFFEPGALVPPLEMFDAVRAGVIDAAFSSPGFWGNKIPALQLFAAIPFGPSAKEFLAWIYFGGGQKMFNEIYKANGIHSIFCGLIAPEAAGWFRNRIRTVEEFKGLRMRFFGLGAKVMNKLGVVTTRLTAGDIFVAFESGDIDAAEFSMPAIDLKLGLHRMIKNYYFPGWHQPSTLFELMINLKKWEALSASSKAQIEAVCGDNIRYGLAEGEASQFQALKALQSQGVVIRRWPGEILDALKAAWVQVAKEESKADKDFNRVWKSLSDFRDTYTIWRELNQP
ncbi:MAG: TRAP transporter substrate-binding protein [Proteobacteria bacterium]|nr:TRAP transporter substrate-binding protein [Pseudomonadota bacterium]